MPDMLVKLYTLPDLQPLLARQRQSGVDIRRALAPEKYLLADWVSRMWGGAWAGECDAALSHQPVGCFVAIANAQPIGFACHDATCKNFFGPTGVDPAWQKHGIGTALLLSCLHAMAAQGYAYAIIGGAGSTEFYARTVGAVVIEDSTPGIYRGLLRKPLP